MQEVQTEPLETAEQRESIAELKQLSTISAKELQEINFPPIQYIVQGYVPEGLTVFAGAPKLGKSWMCLDLAYAVAEGRDALGNVQCEQGDVLYLALEDNKRRLKDRMSKYCPVQVWPENLLFVDECPKVDEGGIEYIENWVASVSNPRLIIIDTLQKVREERSSKDSSYEADYKAVEGLKRIVEQHSNLALMVVHHTRKLQADDPLDEISGTQGIAGAADNAVILQRDGNGAKLYARGRDIEEVDSAVRFENYRWHVEGKADEVRQSEQRKQIREALRELDEAGPKEIADMTGVSNEVVKHLLGKMVKDGVLDKQGRGRYSLARCQHTQDMIPQG